MCLSKPYLGGQSALSADQFIISLTILPEKFIVDPDVLDLADGINALHIQCELRFVACARIDDFDFVVDFDSASVLDFVVDFDFARTLSP